MSSSRPGVAISTSTPRVSTSFWSAMLSPPISSACCSCRYLPYCDEVFGDLQRQLARRLQDQAARHPCPRARPGQDVEHRQGEAGGLAGAGLRGAEHVAAHQHDRDRLALDRRGGQIALLGDRAEHGVRRGRVRQSWFRSAAGGTALVVGKGAGSSARSVSAEAAAMSFNNVLDLGSVVSRAWARGQAVGRSRPAYLECHPGSQAARRNFAPLREPPVAVAGDLAGCPRRGYAPPRPPRDRCQQHRRHRASRCRSRTTP